MSCVCAVLCVVSCVRCVMCGTVSVLGGILWVVCVVMCVVCLETHSPQPYTELTKLQQLLLTQEAPDLRKLAHVPRPFTPFSSLPQNHSAATGQSKAGLGGYKLSVHKLNK